MYSTLLKCTKLTITASPRSAHYPSITRRPLDTAPSHPRNHPASPYPKSICPYFSDAAEGSSSPRASSLPSRPKLTHFDFPAVLRADAPSLASPRNPLATGCCAAALPDGGLGVACRHSPSRVSPENPAPIPPAMGAHYGEGCCARARSGASWL